MLELGCGDGGNLAPMAYGLPGSSFRGIDLSRRAIERAHHLAAALGLANVGFERADLTALPALGVFDYVIAHGVYSWIEPAARDALLAACRDHLAPGGVAYVSYDVLPGGHLREITRQMLRWHLRGVDEPEERIARARALLEAVAGARPEGDEMMRLAAERALQQGDAALFHDELAPHHEAVLFADFVAHAGRHGLRFLAEADVFQMEAGALPPELASGPIEREQYLDFFKGRMFRQTLLCHSGAEQREGGLEVVRGMLAATPAHAAGETGGRVEFRGPLGATLTTDHEGVKAALDAARRGVAGGAARRRAGRRPGRGRDAPARVRGEPGPAPRLGPAAGHGPRGAPGRERARAPAGRRGDAGDHAAAHERRGRGRARPAADPAARRHARPRGPAGRARAARGRARAQPRGPSADRAAGAPLALPPISRANRARTAAS